MHMQQIQALALMEPDPKGAGTKNGKQIRDMPLAVVYVGLCVLGLQYRNSVPGPWLTGLLFLKHVHLGF